MARHEDTGGVSALVRHTAGMAELAINAGHPDRKHNEYLPYPDNNFTDPADERFQRGSIPLKCCLMICTLSLSLIADKFTVAHVYDRSGRTFVPNVSVRIKSIVAERISAGFTEFLNPYL